VLAPAGVPLQCLDSHRYNPFGRIAHEVAGSFFPADPPQFTGCRSPTIRLLQIMLCPAPQRFIIRTSQISGREGRKDDPRRRVVCARHWFIWQPAIDQNAERGGVDSDRVADAIWSPFVANVAPMLACRFQASSVRNEASNGAVL